MEKLQSNPFVVDRTSAGYVINDRLFKYWLQLSGG